MQFPSIFLFTLSAVLFGQQALAEEPAFVNSIKHANLQTAQPNPPTDKVTVVVPSAPTLETQSAPPVDPLTRNLRLAGASALGLAGGATIAHEIYKRTDSGQDDRWRKEFRKGEHFVINVDEQGAGGTYWYKEMSGLIGADIKIVKEKLAKLPPNIRLVHAVNIFYLQAMMDDEELLPKVYRHLSKNLVHGEESEFVQRLSKKLDSLTAELENKFYPVGSASHKAIDDKVERMVERSRDIDENREINDAFDRDYEENITQWESRLNREYNAGMDEATLAECMLKHILGHSLAGCETAESGEIEAELDIEIDDEEEDEEDEETLEEQFRRMMAIPRPPLKRRGSI